MKTLGMFAVSALVLAAGAGSAFGQAVIGAKSGVINYVEGKAFLNDKLYEMQPAQFGEVKENMVLRTEEGRAEVLLTPGVVLRMGENTSIKMITNRLIDTRLELLTGSAVVESDDISKETSLVIVCKDATVSLNKIGLYRFNADPAQLKVFAKGPAEVKLGTETVSLPAGKMMLLGGAVAMAEKFSAEDTDSLDHWSRRRGELMAMANVSAAKQAQYSGSMSAPCSGYGGYGNSGYGNVMTSPTIHPYGSWGYNPYYGMGTYIPCNGSVWSPYGYRFWSPLAVYRAYFAPRPVYNPNMGGGGFGQNSAAYSGMGSTNSGYSGAIASAPSMGSSSAGTSAGASSAASAGGSSAGHGGGGSAGGHGK